MNKHLRRAKSLLPLSAEEQGKSIFTLREKRLIHSKRVGLIVGATEEMQKYLTLQIEEISEILQGLGYKITVIPFDNDIITNLRVNGIEIAFILDSRFIGKKNCVANQLSRTARYSFQNNEGKDLRLILEELKIPYTGSSRSTYEVIDNKVLVKTLFESIGLDTPSYASISSSQSASDEAQRLLEQLTLPVVIKAADRHSSSGVSVVKFAEELDITIEKIRRVSNALYVEQFIRGTEVTIPILEINSRPQALGVIEIVHPGDVFSEEVKLQDFLLAENGQSNFSCEYFIPARIPDGAKKKALQAAIAAHQVVKAEGYSRIDMIIDERLTPQVLEVNTSPLLHSKDFFGWAAEKAGMTYDQVIENILESATHRQLN